jgi:hypothetical protein
LTQLDEGTQEKRGLARVAIAARRARGIVHYLHGALIFTSVARQNASTHTGR